jgi:hypothetical protein
MYAPLNNNIHVTSSILTKQLLKILYQLLDIYPKNKLTT